MGYNLINNIVVFPRARTIAISNHEFIKFFRLNLLACNDPLALTCEAFDSEKSLTCDPSSGVSNSIVEGIEVQNCYCNEATPYYDYDTKTCSGTKVCVDEQANTCDGPTVEETRTCIKNAVFDPISRKCKCSIGAYFDAAATNPVNTCVQCPNHPASCNGPDPEDVGFPSEFSLIGIHKSRHVHGVCIVETDDLKGFVIVETNSANYFSVDTSADPKFLHQKYIPLNKEENIKVGRCKHIGAGEIYMTSTLVRKFDANPATDDSFTIMEGITNDLSHYGVITKAQESSIVFIAIDDNFNEATDKHFYSFNDLSTTTYD